MKPYEIDIDRLSESKEITDQKELLKLKLTVSFLKLIEKMDTQDILSKTGLHKADLSRLRSLSIERFSIDRIIGLLDLLGHYADVKVKPKKAS